MSISDELEKLAGLRDKGDLSAEEFEQAKAKLLVDESSAPPPVPTQAVSASGKRKVTKKDVHLRLACAIMTTIAAVLNGAGMSINPNPLKAIAFTLFILATVFWWISYAKGQAELSS